MQREDEDDGSVSRRIARTLSLRIVNGTLAPGAPVRQDHVAAEFRASHVPVREAFRKLEAVGLLVSEPRRGVRVAPLNASVVQEVTEMRAALETLALRHAAARLGPSDFAAASQAIGKGEISDDAVIWEESNRDFHRAITVSCGMPRLLGTIDELHQASARFRHAAWKDLNWQPRSDQEHREILAALEKGDVEAAAASLRAHILDGGQVLIDALENRAG